MKNIHWDKNMDICGWRNGRAIKEPLLLLEDQGLVPSTDVMVYTHL